MDLLDELMMGQGPRVDPYLLILQDYISTWVEDLREALLNNKSRLYRSYRLTALGQAVLGMAGEYEDLLLSRVAIMLQVPPAELWRRLFITAYQQARREYEGATY